MKEKLLASAHEYLLSSKERILGYFSTFHRRPMYAKDCSSISTISPAALTAIVMQGPIIGKHDFTLETIKLYKKIFPGALLILSTWDDTDSPLLAPLRNEGVELILNPKPSFAGISNVNLQILSTAEGLHRAQKLGAEYALKTRTDQRIYASNTLAYLHALTGAFPLSLQTIQKKRLITTSLNTFKYRPYSISDMFLFGHIDDMLLYWDVPLDQRVTFFKSHTIRAWVEATLCEVYFVTHFLKKIGCSPLFSIADSWEVYRDHFCVVDQHSIDLYWNKYEREKEYRNLRYDGIYTDEEFTFKDWIILYTNTRAPETAPESVLEQSFGSKII